MVDGCFHTMPSSRASLLPTSESTVKSSAFFSEVESEKSGSSGEMAMRETPEAVREGRIDWRECRARLQKGHQPPR
jgi:hypothetical protein